MGIQSEYKRLDLIADELEELRKYAKDTKDVRELIKMINRYKKSDMDIIWVEDKEEFMLETEAMLSAQLDKLYKQQSSDIEDKMKAVEGLLSLVKSNIGKVAYNATIKAVKYITDVLDRGLLYHYYDVSEKIYKDIDKITKEGR